MLFPTLDYLIFLALCVAIYWAVPPRARLWVLGLSSLAFYASWRVSYLPLLLAVVILAWASGQWLARAPRGRFSRTFILGALFLPLLNYKYWNWIAVNIEIVANSRGWDLLLPRADTTLPIGISFFTFQAVAYVIDSARDGKPDPSLGRMGTFILFFPQLIAGPIVRRHELMPQLRSLPMLQADNIGAGLYRIGRGMFKKVLVADILSAGMVQPLFADPSRFGSLELLVGLYAYTIQIYFDFSGYTDIAIGSARLFGIELPENFRRPYKATSIAGFWRRWHITLSNWVRDYIYYPLGGARVASWKVYRNFLITFVVIGLWHRARWNLLLYGVLHGLAASVNRWQRKRTGRKPDDPLPNWWAWTWRFFLTFNFVVFARILFVAKDFSMAKAYTLGLLHNPVALPRFSLLAWTLLALGFAIHFSPDDWQPRAQRVFVRGGPLAWALALALLAAACMLLGTGDQLAFIYYQF